MTGGDPAAIARLSAAERSRDPYLHIEPCFLNMGKCMKVFGSLFREFYMKRTIKENTDFAAIFNHHLLVTFAMDAALEREARTLGEALADLSPGELVCSIETLAGTGDVKDKDWSRNRVELPYAYPREVFADFYNNNFLSVPEREALAAPRRLALMGQIMAIEDDYIVVEPMILGTPSFDHYRNEEDLEHIGALADGWFETLPGDFAELAGLADIAAKEPNAEDWQAALGGLDPEQVRGKLRDALGGPVGEAGGDIDLFELTLAGEAKGVAVLFAPDEGDIFDQAARLAATPAAVLVVQHCGPKDERARRTLGAFAVAPHAPRRFCLIDGPDTYRILKSKDDI